MDWQCRHSRRPRALYVVRWRLNPATTTRGKTSWDDHYLVCEPCTRRRAASLLKAAKRYRRWGAEFVEEPRLELSPGPDP